MLSFKGRHLTRRYVGALLVVAGLLVAGQYIVQLALDRQEGDARVVNMAGRQRMLSQRLCMWLLALDVDGANHVSANLAEIDRVARDWELGHDTLQQASNTPEVRALFHQLDADQQAMLAAARDAIAANGRGAREFADAARSHQDAFLATMDEIVATYEREARERVLWLRHTELGLLACLLIVLAVEGWFVFRPAVRGLDLYLVERDQAQQALLEAGDREERELAQDLHDGLSQHLVGVSYLVRSLPQDPRIAEVGTLIAEAIEQTRGLARRLYSYTLEVDGLVPALRELATQTERVFGIACTVIAPHGDIEILMPVRGHLYRIAREAVHNAAKHAQARSITLTVEPTTIVVSDDGIGIAPHSNAGMGLRLMESRAKMTGAVLRVEGTPKGTIVTCSVPA